MNRILIWQLAMRYLRGKRTGNAVPILSRISMVAIAVCSGAMIVVFSVFNGLESTVKDLYKAFCPDIQVCASRGKFFRMEESRISAIANIKGIRAMSRVIEDHVLVNNNNNKEQKVITLKGIDGHYLDVNNVRPFMVLGEDSVSTGNPYTAIAGMRILNELGLDVNNVFSFFELYYLNPNVTNPELNPLGAYQSLRLHPAGAFRVQDDFDGKYVLAPLVLAQQLFLQPGAYSSIEINTGSENVDRIKSELQHLLGPAYKVESRYEQNKTMYMVMGAEKWAVYAILLLVLLIASFNMVGALSMLVMEKQKDIAILKAMGANTTTIRRIFFTEGMLWAAVGGTIGIGFGTIICLIQKKFGLVKLGGAFLMDAYPVEIQWADLALVIATIFTVGLMASWLPALRATRASDPSLKSA